MKWTEYFFEFVKISALKSKDPSIKVGAVICTEDNEIISTGFNGMPRFINENIESRWKRPIKYFWIEHAERNAIYNAAKKGISLNGAKIFVKWLPCAECSRGIIQSGIKEIYIDKRSYGTFEKSGDIERDKMWKENFEIAKEMLKEAEIEVYII